MLPNAICAECSAGATYTYHITPSPVHELLGTNLPLSTKTEIDVAREALEDLQKDLDDLDRDILQTRIAYQRLLAKRNALQDYADAHKGLLGPLRRLPAEMLAEIFIHALPEYPANLSVHDAPLLSQSVCRRWRDVSRSTPELWSRICIHLGNGRFDAHLEIASAFVIRSAKHPLSISLGPLEHYPTIIPEGHPALRLLATQCERWHALRLQLPLPILRELTIAKGRLMSLNSLHLITGATYRDTDEAILDTFACAPRLKSFQANAHEWDDIVDTRALLLPWSCLTSLHLDERRAGVIWALLQDCPNLAHLEAHIGDGTPDIDVPNVKLPHLLSLSLAFQETSAILSTLTLPILEQASFRLTTATTDPVAVTWYAAYGTYALRLRDLDDCLHALPELTELDVCQLALDSVTLHGFMEKMTEINESRSIVPKLKRFALSTLLKHRGPEFSWAVLADFVKARRVVGSQFEILQSLELTTDAEGVAAAVGEDGFNGLDTLRAFKAQGMRLEVISEDRDVRWL
ncbi:hypothetical protein FIBSPDRAFT_1045106 [Athelia psychrophila]|uniref:F-box domain-containing protein n=1 Tax=Athelia psychrophila TaxID=1759441 RepID=A0A166IN85_9AGAM|nr:hypothetical protein FIBSPDRAFT_1045106 [Fibularhizoctonia sp. CBS 109695]